MSADFKKIKECNLFAIRQCSAFKMAVDEWGLIDSIICV
ncbi:hypothetical protein FHS77_000129 [Paenochrobactrum gallinarii]|uniref:Uncharacterized protein n=1 Tax=Paenochrobactrum gallinarii TaxID=643673 RepID=A0A841LZR3_9HYPH|nr:hypothetical protein [Paenochrobactrum gallinarii]